MKQNCWEYMECGRQKGGSNVSEFGICPSAQLNNYSGLNKGESGGRICWSVSGTLCRNAINGTFAKSIKSCMICPFLEAVRKEEGNDFRLVAPLESL